MSATDPTPQIPTLTGTHAYSRRKVPRLGDVAERGDVVMDGFCVLAPNLVPLNCTWCGRQMKREGDVVVCDVCDMRGAWPDAT